MHDSTPHRVRTVGVVLTISVLTISVAWLLQAAAAQAAFSAASAAAPTAKAVDTTVKSTMPPQAVTVLLSGSDAAVPGDHPSFAIVAGPLLGTLSRLTAGDCLAPPQPPSGQSPALVACSATIDYTPVANAKGLDSFTYAFVNAGVVSAPATVTVYLPPSGGFATFDRPLTNRGVNAAIWSGGTIDQLAAAVTAAGGTSVTTFVDGKALVLIPGAPAFAQAPFRAAFLAGTLPANTIMFVAR